MATPVEMPKLGNTVEEAILVSWKKGKGDKVSNGEIIAEIETDKATFELPAPVDGTILELFVKEGDLVPVFTNVCAIGEPGESVESLRASGGDAPPAAGAEPPQAVQSAAVPPRQAAAPSSAVDESALSPRARRYLRQRSMEAPPVAGSGPGGRILEQDLIAYFAANPKVSSLARKHMEEGYEIRGAGSGINGMILARDLDAPGQKLPKIREIIARRMRDSLGSSAQYTLSASAEATGLLSLRARIKAAAGRAPDININEMVMFCTVRALIEMPELNAEFINGKIYRRAGINLGFACDTEKGLLVPVVHGCENLSIAEFAARVKELTRQTIDGTVSPDNLTGGTFTVTNLGNLGIESFTPILNVPQVAILGVDAIQLKPVRRGAGVEFVDFIGLSLTCDHQVIDGAPGARFLKLLREKIEQVESLAELNL